jgi:RND family efflux transporter MFP subunit
LAIFLRVSPAHHISASPNTLCRGAFLALVFAGLLAGCKKSNEYVAPPPPKVSVAVPLAQDVTRYLETTGNIAAINTVPLVARVSGFLYSQNYVDGTEMKKGDTLFTIEPPPYYAQLQQAQAQQAAQQAALIQAQQQYARQSTLRNQGVNSVADLDTAQAKMDGAQADLDQAKSSVQLAAINYSYTQVKAPFDGLVSAHLVSVGEMVTSAPSTTLSTIVQLRPIYVNFSVSETDVQRIRANLRARGISLADVKNVPVDVGLQTETGYPHAGLLDYTAPTVDPTAGTLSARGEMANTDRVLLPGMFVRVRVPLGKQPNALMVPDTALGSDQAGSYLLVVDGTNTVQQRTVTTGPLVGALRVIDKGLLAGDHVVVDGLQRAVPGEKVTPTLTTLAAAPDTPAPAALPAKPAAQ